MKAEEKITVVVKESVREIVMTLSEDEARVIRSICGRVLGSGKVREITNSIFWKLETLVPQPDTGSNLFEYIQIINTNKDLTKPF